MRWRYLIKPSLQLRFTLFVFVSMLGLLVFFLWNAYFNMGKQVFSEISDPRAVDLFWSMNAIFVRHVLVYMAALLLLSVFISHKIAGPVYRFEKSAEELGRGRLSHRVRLRSRDELTELQDKLNEMAAALQARVSDDRRRRDLMLRGLEELSADPSLSPVARERLKALRETAEGVTRDFEI